MSDTTTPETPAAERPWNPLSATFFAMRLVSARALKLAGETKESFHVERQRLTKSFAENAGPFADEDALAAFDEALSNVEDMLE